MSAHEDTIREALEYLYGYAMTETVSPPIEGDGQHEDGNAALDALVAERDRLAAELAEAKGEATRFSFAARTNKSERDEALRVAAGLRALLDRAMAELPVSDSLVKRHALLQAIHRDF